jgi:hypothetical protein
MSRQRTPIGNEDTNFFRCRRCGFPCDLSRDRLGPGTGISHDVLDRDSGVTGPDDPVVKGGCAQCGSKNYINYQR